MEEKQSHHITRSTLERMPTAQLEIYLHEVEWIISQLAETPYATREDTPKAHQSEMCKQFIHVEEEIFAIKDVLILERARRSIIHLQRVIEGAGTREQTIQEVIAGLEGVPHDHARCPDIPV